MPLKSGFMQGEQHRSNGSTLDKRVHRFVLFSLLVGLSATIIRWGFVLATGIGDVVETVGGPIAIVVDGSLAFLLWRRPESLNFVKKAIYAFMTGGIGVKLAFLLYSGGAGVSDQFVKIAPWMAVSYLLPFLVFGRRSATVVSSALFCTWTVMTAGHVVVHLGSEQAAKLGDIALQVFPAHCILIVFMTFHARMKAQYLSTQECVQRLDRIANTDFMLGTANRRSTQDFLTKAITQAVETGSPLTVILMDIDRFKEINDMHGHDVGDRVLIETAHLVAGHLKDPAYFGRWGGEEFIVILPDSTRTQAYRVAQRIRIALETHRFQVGQVTASFGLCEYRSGESGQALVKRADEALYAAKRQGRNRVEVVR